MRRVDERVGRAEVVRLDLMAELREPGHCEHRARERVRNGEVGRGRLRGLPLHDERSELRLECGVDRLGRPRDGDVVIVGSDGVDVQAGIGEPLLHLVDRVLRRRELRRVLVGGDELAVLRVRRIGNRLCERVELVCVLRREPHLRVVELGRCGSSGRCGCRRPGRPGPGKRVPRAPAPGSLRRCRYEHGDEHQHCGARKRANSVTITPRRH